MVDSLALLAKMDPAAASTRTSATIQTKTHAGGFLNRTGFVERPRLPPSDTSIALFSDIGTMLIDPFRKSLGSVIHIYWPIRVWRYRVRSLAIWSGWRWPDFESFKADLDDYVIHWNTRRRQVKLKGLTPEEFRNQSLVAYFLFKPSKFWGVAQTCGRRGMGGVECVLERRPRHAHASVFGGIGFGRWTPVSVAPYSVRCLNLPEYARTTALQKV